MNSCVCFWGDVATGWQISEAFEQCGIVESEETAEGHTKWRRIYATLSMYDLPWGADGSAPGYWVEEAKKLIKFLFHPIDYSAEPDQYERLRAGLNQIISWIGLKYTSDAKFVPVEERNAVEQEVDSENHSVKRQELAPDTKRVFVIHGRDIEFKDEICKLLRKWGG